MKHEEQPNSALLRTVTLAAHGVCRPPCLLGMSAAERTVAVPYTAAAAPRRSPAERRHCNPLVRGRNENPRIWDDHGAAPLAPRSDQCHPGPSRAVGVDTQGDRVGDWLRSTSVGGIPWSALPRRQLALLRFGAGPRARRIVRRRGECGREMDTPPAIAHGGWGVKGLFVPGLCCRSAIWDEAGARLPGVEVVALDWPWPERISSYDDGAAWLADELRAHRPQFVVGHSFGGVLALHLCSQLPSRPEWLLVVVDAFLVTPHPFFRNHVWGSEPA